MERIIDELLDWTRERELFSAEELQTVLLDLRLEVMH